MSRRRNQNNPWISALKEWNKGKTTYCIPKKGGPEMKQVRNIMDRIQNPRMETKVIIPKKAKDIKLVIKEDTPPPPPPKSRIIKPQIRVAEYTDDEETDEEIDLDNFVFPTFPDEEESLEKTQLMPTMKKTLLMPTIKQKPLEKTIKQKPLKKTIKFQGKEGLKAINKIYKKINIESEFKNIKNKKDFARKFIQFKRFITFYNDLSLKIVKDIDSNSENRKIVKKLDKKAFEIMSGYNNIRDKYEKKLNERLGYNIELKNIFL